MSSTRTRFAVAAAAALALATPLAIRNADAATTPTAVPAGPAAATSFTPAQVLAGVQANMTTANKVNSKPHINTMTRAQNVNVYQVASGVYAYTSSMAIDTDGSDPDPDPDHQGQTTWSRTATASTWARTTCRSTCWATTAGIASPPARTSSTRNTASTGRQFALMFYNGNVIGSIFGDTQTANNQTTSDNDSRELGEASVKAAQLLGIPSSGTTGGVDNGVTVVMFSGPSWVVNGTNANLNANTQALVQKALDSLGASMGGTPPTTADGSTFEAETGTLSAGGTFDSNHLGFTGTGFANTANAVGAYVDIPVTAATAGTKTLTFRYSDGTTAARPATISVNGTSRGTLNFPITANWDTWATASISVPLTAGTNTIRVAGTTAGGAANIDSVTISP